MIEDLKLVIKGMVKGMMPAPKLHILYRHVGGPVNNQADRPAWFSHEKCFKNFIDSLSGELQEIDLYLHILFDGNDESLNGKLSISAFNFLLCKTLKSFFSENLLLLLLLLLL